MRTTGLVLVGLLAFITSAATPASAATIAELQAQVQILMAQITALQARSGNAPVSVSTSAGVASAKCAVDWSTARNLSRGSRGDGVRSLQWFLIAENYLAVGNDSGFFGPLTETAVKQFQCKHLNICLGTPQSNGYGAIGPRTRAAIVAACTAPSPSVSVPTPKPAPVPTPTPSPTPTPNITYFWHANDWSVCANNQQTRTLQCKNSSGAIVSDSNCTSVKPTVSQACSVSTVPSALSGVFDPVVWMNATKGAGVVKTYGEVWDANKQTWVQNSGPTNPMKMIADFANSHVYFHKDSSWQDFVGQTYSFDANSVWLRTETMGYFNCTDVNPQGGRCDNYSATIPWDVRNDKFRLFVSSTNSEHGYQLAPRPVSHGWQGALDLFDTYYCNSFSELRTSTCTLYQKGNNIFITVSFYKNYDIFNDTGDKVVATPNGTPQQRLFDVMIVSIEEGQCDPSLAAGTARCIARERNFYGRVGDDYWGFVRFDSALRKNGTYELTDRVVAYGWDTSYDPKMDDLKARALEDAVANFQPQTTDPSRPSNLVASCSAAGTQATLSWNPAQGATSYALRVNDTTNDSTQCTSPSVTGTGGMCVGGTDYIYDLASSPTVLTVPKGRLLEWWVHPVTSGGLGPLTIGTSFTCSGQ